MTDVDLQDFIGGFVAESEELVASCNAMLLEIEAAIGERTSRPQAVRTLFRGLHTIKGLAGMVGVEPIVELAHALESIVRMADKRGGVMSREVTDVVLRGVAAIGERVEAVANERAVAAAPSRLLDEIANVEGTEPAVSLTPPVHTAWDDKLSASERQQVYAALERHTPVWTVTFAPSDERAASGITIGTVRDRLATLGEIVKIVPRARAVSGAAPVVTFDLLVIGASADTLETIGLPLEAVVPLAGDNIAAGSPAPPSPTEPLAELPPEIGRGDVAIAGRTIVRVELERLDELQEQLSSLTVSRFRLEREIAALHQRGTDVRTLREIAEQQTRQLRDLRRAILRARMVKASDVLEPLALVVRSVARTSQREVQLALDTSDAELDKAVADRLLPALVHIVRNAVDHAIESPDERVAVGKARFGTILIRSHEAGGNQIVIEVEDDGRGIDRERIAAQAGRAIGDNASLLDAISGAGFSTQSIATRTSGRGLGMDIVRRIVVGELGGDLSLRTARGRGTTFRIEVPVTIAVVDVFSFICGAQPFVVPVSTVEEIFEIETMRATQPPARSRSPIQVVERHGRALPLVELARILALPEPRPGSKALVAKRNGELVAFAVDRMLGRHEVVVRRIDDPLVRTPGVAGATDLGDGKPTLVLDLDELGAYARARALAGDAS